MHVYLKLDVSHGSPPTTLSTQVRLVLEGASFAKGHTAGGAEEFMTLELERSARVDQIDREELIDLIVNLGAVGSKRTALMDRLVTRMY